ncbi:MAG: hypothetical protein O3A47_09940 [Chloroflexi bacterium]|nr:hypothetical protein [Chloroflexota bacterium]
MSLHNPPSERHLFFDNLCIEMVQDVTRVMHRPNKTGLALIYKDRPWEHIPYFGNAIWSILYSPTEEIFRCWYEDWVLDPDGLINSDVDITDPSVSSSRVMYAESRDGVRWDKPPLGVVFEGGHNTNIVLGDSVVNPNVFGSPHGPTVLDDPFEDDPDRRFKMMFQHITSTSPGTDAVETPTGGQVLHSPIRIAYSGDGIHWTVEPERLDFGGLGPRLGDVMVLTCDVVRQEYVLHTRHPYAWLVDSPEGAPKTAAWSSPYWPDDPARMNKRRIFRSTSRDLIHWCEPHEVLAPDDDEDNLDDSFYSLASWSLSVARTETLRHPYPGNDLHIGIVNVFHQTENVMDAQLVYSRDGVNWRRTGQRQPFLGRGLVGHWDEMISCVPNVPIRVGDELYVYYGGSNSHHDWWVTGARERLDVPEAKDLSIVQHGIGLAKLRFDGYVSLRAGLVREGLFVTRPVKVIGSHLVINATCRRGGYIDVEVSDERNRVIDGLSRDDSVRFHGDSISHRVAWQSGAVLPENRPLKLRFWMRDADLYSFAFTDESQ